MKIFNFVKSLQQFMKIYHFIPYIKVITIFSDTLRLLVKKSYIVNKSDIVNDINNYFFKFNSYLLQFGKFGRFEFVKNKSKFKFYFYYKLNSN